MNLPAENKLSVRNLRFSFSRESSLFEDFSLDLNLGEISVLLGPSGCGKSTLLRLLTGLIPPERGEIQWSGPPQRSAMVFQEPRLLPWRNVEENILLPRELQKSLVTGPSIYELLQLVGLEGREKLFPHELSGGMKQRVALARALSTEPQVLYMDEPFSALDEATREDLQDLLLHLKVTKKMTVVFVTHSLNEAVYLGDRLLLLSRTGAKIRQDLPVGLSRNSELRLQPAFHEKVAVLSAEMRKAQEDR